MASGGGGGCLVDTFQITVVWSQSGEKEGGMRVGFPALWILGLSGLQTLLPLAEPGLQKWCLLFCNSSRSGPEGKGPHTS